MSGNSLTDRVTSFLSHQHGIGYVRPSCDGQWDRRIVTSLSSAKAYDDDNNDEDVDDDEDNNNDNDCLVFPQQRRTCKGRRRPPR